MTARTTAEAAPERRPRQRVESALQWPEKDRQEFADMLEDSISRAPERSLLAIIEAGRLIRERKTEEKKDGHERTE